MRGPHFDDPGMAGLIPNQHGLKGSWRMKVQRGLVGYSLQLGVPQRIQQGRKIGVVRESNLYVSGVTCLMNVCRKVTV